MIEILNVNAINKGSVQATCTVHVKPWKLKIHKVMIFQKGNNRWVSLPSEKFEVDGETKYKDLMEFDDATVLKRFKDQVLLAVDLYIQEKGDLIPEDVVKKNEDFPF